jgi:hypothetical protein
LVGMYMKNKRKTIEIKCNGCKKAFEKAISEYKRNEKNGEKHWCSLKCMAKHANNSKGNPKNLKKGREKDEFSSFRYFLKKIKERHKEKKYIETDITLQFLKELWENQNGLCPITGWSMDLPESTLGFKILVNPRKASLDRIEPHKPYMKNNIRYISFIANMCKHEFCDKDILDFAKAVVNKQSAIPLRSTK